MKKVLIAISGYSFSSIFCTTWLQKLLINREVGRQKFHRNRSGENQTIQSDGSSLCSWTQIFWLHSLNSGKLQCSVEAKSQSIHFGNSVPKMTRTERRVSLIARTNKSRREQRGERVSSSCIL